MQECRSLRRNRDVPDHHYGGLLNMPIPIKLRAYQRHIKRLFFGPGTVQSAAYDRHVIFPKSKARLSPAVFLPGQINKVTDSAPETTRESEVREATVLE